MSELVSELLDSDPEPEPGPTGVNRYVEEALKVSRRLDGQLYYGEWVSDKDSRLAIESAQIRARLSRQAFLNYTQLSVDERFQLEAVATTVMERVDPGAGWDNTSSMMNHVPLLFEPRGGIVIGYRNDDEKSLRLESDGIVTPRQRHVLAGGLATVLFFADYPHLLSTVE